MPERESRRAGVLVPLKTLWSSTIDWKELEADADWDGKRLSQQRGYCVKEQETAPGSMPCFTSADSIRCESGLYSRRE